jgi:hypothetical protein
VLAVVVVPLVELPPAHATETEASQLIVQNAMRTVTMTRPAVPAGTLSRQMSQIPTGGRKMHMRTRNQVLSRTDAFLLGVVAGADADGELGFWPCGVSGAWGWAGTSWLEEGRPSVTPTGGVGWWSLLSMRVSFGRMAAHVVRDHARNV